MGFPGYFVFSYHASPVGSTLHNNRVFIVEDQKYKKIAPAVGNINLSR
jgi:hypothetical protein